MRAEETAARRGKKPWGGARSPWNRQAPQWSPQDGAEPRLIYDAVAAELARSNEAGRGRPFELVDVLRCRYDHVRRGWHSLLEALRNPDKSVHHPGGFFWSAITSPFWLFAEGCEASHEQFLELLEKRFPRPSSGETRPSSSTRTSSPSHEVRGLEVAVDETPPAPPRSSPPPTPTPGELERRRLELEGRQKPIARDIYLELPEDLRAKRDAQDLAAAELELAAEEAKRGGRLPEERRARRLGSLVGDAWLRGMLRDHGQAIAKALEQDLAARAARPS